MLQANQQQERRPVPLIDPARCNGCGLCVRVCPHNVLEMNSGTAVVVRPEACEYVGLCEAICPTKAIQRLFEIVMLDAASDGP